MTMTPSLPPLQARLADEHERMKKRLAQALAAAEQAQLESLDAATARAMGLASVTVEDSDVRLLEAELSEAKEEMNVQKELATEEVRSTN